MSGVNLVSFAKGVSKHLHIFPIFKMVSEYLRFPSTLKLDYFIFYSIRVSFSVTFHPFLAMKKRRCTDEAENSSFIRGMFTCSIVNRNDRQTIILRNRPDISYQSQH